jgi:hypothetical protein
MPCTSDAASPSVDSRAAPAMAPAASLSAGSALRCTAALMPSSARLALGARRYAPASAGDTALAARLTVWLAARTPARTPRPTVSLMARTPPPALAATRPAAESIICSLRVYWCMASLARRISSCVMPLRLMAYRSDLKSGAVLIFSSQCSCCGVTGGLGSSPRAASKSPGSLAALPRRSPS